MVGVGLGNSTLDEHRTAGSQSIVGEEYLHKSTKGELGIKTSFAKGITGQKHQSEWHKHHPNSDYETLTPLQMVNQTSLATSVHMGGAPMSTHHGNLGDGGMDVHMLIANEKSRIDRLLENRDDEDMGSHRGSFTEF